MYCIPKIFPTTRHPFGPGGKSFFGFCWLQSQTPSKTEAGVIKAITVVLISGSAFTAKSTMIFISSLDWAMQRYL